MTEELVERCARALAPVALPYIEDYDEVPPEHIWTRPRYEWLSFAMVQMSRAIIPIVLEEAAKVADAISKDWAYVQGAGDPATWQPGSPYDWGKQKAAKQFAQAIRSLSSPILTEEGVNVIPAHWTPHDGQGMPVDPQSCPAVMFRRKAYGMKTHLTINAGVFHAAKWEDYGGCDCWKWDEEGPDDIIAYLVV